MNPWILALAIGIPAWFALSVLLGLAIGPALARNSRVPQVPGDEEGAES